MWPFLKIKFNIYIYQYGITKVASLGERHTRYPRPEHRSVFNDFQGPGKEDKLNFRIFPNCSHVFEKCGGARDRQVRLDWTHFIFTLTEENEIQNRFPNVF